MTYQYSEDQDSYQSREDFYRNEQRRLDRREPYFEDRESYDNTDHNAPANEAEPHWQHESGDYVDEYGHGYSPAVDLSYDQPAHNNDSYYDNEDARGFNRLSNEKVEPYIDSSFGSSTHGGIQIQAADLRDVGQRGAFPDIGKFAVRIGVLAGMVLVGSMLYLSLKPKVTAYDIISMEGYQGQQLPEWTLDPTQVNDCDSLSACFKEELALQQKVTESQTQTIAEIPASTTEVPAPTDVSVPATVPATTVQPSTLFVSQRWSNLREEPGMQGAIIRSVDINTEVEVLGQQDSWYEIRTLDGSGVQGFMHENTLRNP